MVVTEPTQADLVRALKQVEPGGTILFADYLAGETITMTGQDIVIQKGVTIDGGDLGITIDANRESRVFYIDANVEVVINGLTLTGGYSEIATHNSGNGGAIFNRYATLSVINTTITDNESRDGAAIFNCHGELYVVDSTIVENEATRFGGAVYNFGKTATISIANSVLTGNSTAATNGDVYIREGAVAAYHSLIGAVAGNIGLAKNIGSEIGVDAADVFEYEDGALVFDGCVPMISETGLAVDFGTLVGKTGGDWYFVDKVTKGWHQCGEDGGSRMTYDETAADFGLTDGFVIGTAQNVDSEGFAVSRLTKAAERKFDVGAYALTDDALIEIFADGESLDF